MLVTEHELHPMLSAERFELVGELLGETIVEESSLTVDQGDLLAGMLTEDFLEGRMNIISLLPFPRI